MTSGPWHTAVAFAAKRAGDASRLLRLGGGVAITGKVLTTLSPGSIDHLARGRRVVLVSGTNGKSTTARLLAEAWGAEGPVLLNEDGSNLLSGVGHALLTSPHRRVVLEVDEQLLPEVMRRTKPELVVLLNLSRDQLDRVGEISTTVRRWRQALQECDDCPVVANADDPVLVAAVLGAFRTTWVGAGLLWREDARTCQRCGHPLATDDPDWWCECCGLERPRISLGRHGHSVVRDGDTVDLELGLPGEGAAANATMALAAALRLGVDIPAALDRMRKVQEVGGRYAQGILDGHQIRLLLMKNPASARSVLDLVAAHGHPVIVVLNAEAADGRDPSWLWDVPFERLRGRQVVASGRRAADLSVRLAYANVPHLTAPDLAAALTLLPAGPCDVIANYSAFAAVNRRLRC